MRWLLAALFLLAGCFDSLLSDPCARGYTFSDGRCVASDTAPDAGTGTQPDSTVIVATVDATLADGPVCTADTQNDPYNCGACGVVCPSGVCSAGVCAGAISGHIVAIGHDFAHYDAAMARVLADSVALGVHHDVAVARWQGTASNSASTGTSAALTAGMSTLPRPWHWTAMPSSPAPLTGIDVVLVDAQLGDATALETTGAAWKSAFDDFLVRGGVIVVLEGPTSASYHLADGAGLYTIGAPVDCGGQLAHIVAPNDAVTQQVLSPYAALAGSVTLPSIASPVIETASGDPLVAHLTR